MAGNVRRYEDMLFNYETTGRTDLRDGEITPLVKTQYVEKPFGLSLCRPPPLKDIHALTDWRVPSLPFNLFWERKPILRTDPRDRQMPCKAPPDLELEAVRKTRPRLVMTPALALDDIEDESVRKLLLDDIYMTSSVFCSRDVTGAAPCDRCRAPFSDTRTPDNPISLPKLSPPLVPPEWRMASASWDGRQLRSHVSPTRQFWSVRQSYCSVCNDTEVRAAMKTMKRASKRR